MKYFQPSTINCMALGILIAGTSTLWGKVGFGFGPFKKPIELQSRQPAAVRLANTSVFFEGASTNKEYFPVQDSLLITLGTELISHEKTLVVKDTKADAEWTFSANITGYSVSPPSSRSEQSGKQTLTYTVWNGSLNVAYHVIDPRGTVYDAGNVDYNYHKEFENSASGEKSRFDLKDLSSKNPFSHKPKSAEIVPATQEDVKQILIRSVVRQIASKLGNTTQPLEVQVAAGEENLNHAAEFMKNGLWSRALDALQKAPTFPNADEEAFHQYDIGLTYEAMSYDSNSSGGQRDNIVKAADYYDKALELNPNEKYFVQTVARARDAVARYQALDRMKREDKKIEEAKNQAAAQSPADAKMVQKESKNSKAVTVSDVIQMRSAGVEDDQIIEYIRSAPKVEFDPVDKDTMIAMAKAKLPVTIQNALRSKVNSPLLPTARPVKNAAK